MAKKRIFISHCETNFTPTNYAINIIDLIGCTPVIAEKEPKLSRNVRSLVDGTMESCDAAIVIATPDGDTKDGKGKQPSASVLVEIGNLQKDPKFKGKYVIIKEENVVLPNPMISEYHYKFNMSDFSRIAIAILVELGSMSMFRNYYQFSWSDLQLHDLLDALSSLKDMRDKGFLTPDQFKTNAKDMIEKVSNKILGVS